MHYKHHLVNPSVFIPAYGEKSNFSSTKTKVSTDLVLIFICILMALITHHYYSTLSSCCHALLALLYPFEWQV